LLHALFTFVLGPLLVQMLINDSFYDKKKGGDATYSENKLRHFVSEEFALAQWANLVASMLDADPSKRPTAVEANKSVDEIHETLERVQN